VLQLEIPPETVYHTLRFARQHGVRTILNPAPGQALDLAELAHADYVIPNETEAESLGGMPVHNVPEALTCAESLVARGLRRVIVTLGGDGVVCAGIEGARHVGAHSVTPVDTTGAGDAFIGCFATSLARGLPEVEAIERANVYAALSTLAVGTQMSFATEEQFEEAWGKRGK
jgi:ribokinase